MKITSLSWWKSRWGYRTHWSHFI